MDQLPPPPPTPETAESYHHRKMGSRNIKDRTDRMKEVIENVFSESKVDRVLKKYFKNNNLSKIKNLTESYKQEKAVSNFMDNNPNAKFLGKTSKGQMVFEVLNERFYIFANGNVI